MSIGAAEYTTSQRKTSKNQWVLDAMGPLTNDALLFLQTHSKVWGAPDQVITRFNIKSARLLKDGKGRGEEVIIWPASEGGIYRVYRYKRVHKARRWLTLPPGKGACLFGDLDAAAYVVCEGEWDVFAAYDLGLSGVICGTAGAGTWLAEWSEQFRGKPVAVVYDIDQQGRDGARKVCETLHGIASEVRNVVLPLDPKVYPSGDLSDYIGFDSNMQRRHTLNDLTTLISNTPPFDPTKALYPPVPPPSRTVLVDDVRETVEQHFPGLWPIAEVCLSVPHTLLLRDQSNPVGINLVDVPSSQKTTVLDMFRVPGVVYRTDAFSPKAFLTHTTATRDPRDLEKIDLLPRIRFKTVIIPELAPLFSLPPHELEQAVAVLTRIFDGQGFQSDSGAHGHREQVGDYLFAWLAATTPLKNFIWEILGKLGSRWLWLVMPQREWDPERTMRELTGPVAYRDRLTICREVVSEFIQGQWARYGGIRNVRWERGADPPHVVMLIMRLGELVARLRGVVAVSRERYGDQGYVWQTPIVEEPIRVSEVLLSLAQGHALVYGRLQLTEQDLPPVARVALSSCPEDRRKVFKEIMIRGGCVTSTQVEQALDTSRPTARVILTTLKVLGLGQIEEKEGPHPHTFVLGREHRWILEAEEQELLQVEVTPF